MYTKDDVSRLLDIFIPQHFDTVVISMQNALSIIDPSWQKGQFEMFSKHFRQQFWRSHLVKRLLLNDAKFPVLNETDIFEKIIDLSRSMNDLVKAAFYGDVLSEYVLLFPIAKFPQWAASYKDKSNWLAHWHLHSTTRYALYK